VIRAWADRSGVAEIQSPLDPLDATPEVVAASSGSSGDSLPNAEIGIGVRKMMTRRYA
jgi:hypothetical protein